VTPQPQLKGWFSFYFTTDGDSDEPERCYYRFAVEGDRQTFVSYFQNYGDFARRSGELEEQYGLHDVSGSIGDLEGFISDEVEEDRQMALMKEWRTWFKEHGFTTGEIFEVALNDGEIPRDIEDNPESRLFYNQLDDIRALFQ
jgi:hypothetical protein